MFLFPFHCDESRRGAGGRLTGALCLREMPRDGIAGAKHSEHVVWITNTTQDPNASSLRGRPPPIIRMGPAKMVHTPIVPSIGKKANDRRHTPAGATVEPGRGRSPCLPAGRSPPPCRSGGSIFSLTAVVVVCCLGKNDTWRVLPVNGTTAITSVTSASAANLHTTKPDSTNYR